MTTASGTLTYTSVLTPAAAERGGYLSPISIGSKSIYVDIENPYTQNKIEGWKWDERIWPDENIENINESIPALFDPTVSGITETYFQSGIGSGNDLYVHSVEDITSSGIQTSGADKIWAPLVEHGHYFDYSEEGYLFSDDSIVEYPTYSGIKGGISGSFSTVVLSKYPKVGVPIVATQWQWDENKAKYVPFKKFEKKVSFTGQKDVNNLRQDTWDEDTQTIYYNLIDASEPEFIVTYSGEAVTGITSNPELLFNQQCSTPIGTITVSGIPDTSSLDFVGYSTGTAAQQLHCTYSPIDTSAPVRVFSWSDSGSGSISALQEWNPVYSGLTTTGYQVLVDRDLGLLRFGTSPLPPSGNKIGVHYNPTVQIEYEPELSSNTVLATEANANPFYRYKGRGFIYLSPKEEDPTSIILSADLPEVSEDRFGPLYIGTNYAPIIATVYDSKGNELEGISVTISLTSSPEIGSFGSTDNDIICISNENGEAKTYYNPPQDLVEIGENIEAANVFLDPAAAYVDFPTVTSTTTLRTTRISVEASTPPDDVYVYKTYTDDPLLGVLYTGIDPTDAQAQINEYYRQYFADQGLVGPIGLTTGGIATSEAISWEEAHRIVWDLSRPSVYESNKGMGSRYLVTTYDTEALNPHNPTLSGVWIPKQPFLVNDLRTGQYDVIFDTTSDVMAAPSGSFNSYFLVAPTTVTLQASAYNSRIGRTVYSNEIQLKLEIPSYMNGTWIIDDINNMTISELSSLITTAMEGRKLPLGFRLKSNTVTLAAALDGVTYLDTNATDDPVLAPSTWPHLGHKFEVT